VVGGYTQVLQLPIPLAISFYYEEIKNQTKKEHVAELRSRYPLFPHSEDKSLEVEIPVFPDEETESSVAMDDPMDLFNPDGSLKMRTL